MMDMALIAKYWFEAETQIKELGKQAAVVKKKRWKKELLRCSPVYIEVQYCNINFGNK